MDFPMEADAPLDSIMSGAGFDPLEAASDGGGFWSGVGDAISGAGAAARDFVRSGGATAALNAYAADRNARAAEETARRNAAAGRGVPVMVSGGIDKKWIMAGAAALALVAVILIARRK